MFGNFEKLFMQDYPAYLKDLWLLTQRRAAKLAKDPDVALALQRHPSLSTVRRNCLERLVVFLDAFHNTSHIAYVCSWWLMQMPQKNRGWSLTEVLRER